MKKLSSYLLAIATFVALVACNSGSENALSLNISPETCSIGSNSNVIFSYSGLAMNESAFLKFTNPAGVPHTGSCTVGDSTCLFSGNSGSFSLDCQNVTLGGGVGKYIYTLKQGAGNAAVTINVTQ